ncbi:hypothetical protein KR084_003190 [Drosophila pseudotakahashii]|nr:hypothetical protein KR084_003190 [Drosophila pseudotakahashii]
MKALLFIGVLWGVTYHTNSIKIGISYNYNNTELGTATTESSATTASSSIEAGSSISPLLEVTNAPGNTFPPRLQQKPKATDATPTTSPNPQVDAQPLNATQTPPSIPISKDLKPYYCSCDLHSDKCDLNCCCDKDCPPEAHQVFNCLPSPTFPQVQSRLEDFQYAHGLPTCQINDGWLCVFRSNTEPYKTQPQNSNFDSSQCYKWLGYLGAYDSDSAQSRSSISHYKFGQPLQLWQPETRQLATFDLPAAYESPNCQLKQSISHLQPIKSICKMKDLSQLQDSLWGIFNLTSTFQLLPKPLDLEEHEVKGLVVHVCQRGEDKSLQCLERGNDTQLDVMVDKVELILIHNFTHILEAKLLLEEIKPAEDDNEPLWLQYNVEFITLNDSLVKATSGPLGYLLGSPLIFSRMLPQNNSEDKTLFSYLNTNHNTEEFQWVSLPSRKLRERSCHRKLDQNQVLRFGIDLLTRCELHHVAPLLQEHANHSEYCQGLQAQIWSQLLPHDCSHLDDLGKVFVSQLGRPEPDKWLPMQVEYLENTHEMPPPIQSVYNKVKRSLSCQNIFLSVGYEFYVADLSLLDGRAPHQRVLQNTRMVLGQRHDLEFDISETEVALPVSISVMFYQMQKKALSGAVGVVFSGVLPAITYIATALRSLKFSL